MIFLIIVLGGGSLSGCASSPSGPVTSFSAAVGEKAARTAVSMIGRPYRDRGDSPEGFDCSGLVRYSYLTAGVDAPHGTEFLMKVTRSLSMSNARIGDLLFFEESGKKYSHVGIYLGNDLFVHAPSSGGKVKKDSLRDPHWRKSFLEVRRFN
ncbi:MAG TPA: C40 family peptidase [Nitrospirota bacterium]|nr:C40 family peptidase [Nitrospirota bacterium]